LGYVAARLDLHPAFRSVLRVTGSSLASVSVAAGYEVASFVPFAPGAVELLSIIVPVYNEELYLRQVLDALLAKELPIDKEVIIVESASTDSSREIVRSFERKPGVRVLYQDRARGKGNAVREALEHARGTIVLIQDADFEYDLEDYDALLEPIVQRRSSFVLGSRSLGIDDWKVRQYATSPVKSFLMNFAQLVFARTFNVLYQQKVTDINTMFKVFRRDCLDGVHLLGNGFNFDIELVCKIVRNGYDPLEVPVNYVARSFEEGKKINFLLDAYPSYYQLFRCRFGPI
jgi:glycosyltransferase involved in cell wall biosynthesis